MTPRPPRLLGILMVIVALVLVVGAFVFSDQLGPVMPVLLVIAVFNIVRGGLWLLRSGA